jgi:hypothetical protein
MGLQEAQLSQATKEAKAGQLGGWEELKNLPLPSLFQILILPILQVFRMLSTFRRELIS